MQSGDASPEACPSRGPDVWRAQSVHRVAPPPIVKREKLHTNVSDAGRRRPVACASGPSMIEVLPCASDGARPAREWGSKPSGRSVVD